MENDTSATEIPARRWISMSLKLEMVPPMFAINTEKRTRYTESGEKLSYKLSDSV